MKKKRFKTNSAVFAIILDEKQKHILLQKRSNTGCKDGFYDLGTAGHVDGDESMKQALQRELVEEIGINVELDDLIPSSFMHVKYGEGDFYYNGYFMVKKYTGTPTIVEPDKNAELKWFPIHELPENIIPDRKVGIDNYLNDVHYSEIGWE
ncbi:NUDIX hydrolase [Fructilactobacillus sp. Tb1]|uniref:NUDIX hydrolase n=1 Tax=Fructilactobacillus sp. Tb1 TaxID=3422304 RepID=UPI003D2804B7